MQAEVIHRFLESVGQKADVDLYLRLFRAERKESFAVIAVDAAVVREAQGPLHFDLRLLASLGLTPVVLLGLVDPQGTEEQAKKIEEWLAEDQVAARVIATPANTSRDLVGSLSDTLASGVVPLLAIVDASGPDEAPESRRDVDRRFALLGEVTRALETRKVVFLGTRAGLGRKGGRTVSLVNLSTDYEALLSTGELTRKEVALLRQIRVLLTERVGHPMTVAVTNPLHLLRELFTMKGAGTLIKRGSIIERHDGTLGVDLARLKGLLESAFGRRLKEGFFEQPIERVYLEESYQGAALVTSSPCGKYLSKFAVERQAQGEGIGRDLWGALIRDYPSIYWRSRPGNPVDPWYATRCDGMQRGPEWHVFWKGFDADCIPHLIRCALAAPRDLEG